MNTPSKEDRLKHGITGKPIPCTRVLFKEMDRTKFAGKESFALLALNEVDGTYTGVNVYAGRTGANYDPSKYTHPLPKDVDAFVKEKCGKGYSADAAVGDFEALVEIQAEVEVDAA